MFTIHYWNSYSPEICKHRFQIYYKLVQFKNSDITSFVMQYVLLNGLLVWIILKSVTEFFLYILIFMIVMMLYFRIGLDS